MTKDLSKSNGWNKKTNTEKQHDLLSAILDQQLHEVAESVGHLAIELGGANTIGDDLDDPDLIQFRLMEGARKEYTTKGKLKKHFNVYSIMPDRPAAMERMAKVLAELVLKQIRGGKLIGYERSQHTPNLVPAKDLFHAVASAYAEDNDTAENTLSLESLCTQAYIKSEWPLKIVRGTKEDIQAAPVQADTPIDCPEYLLFHAYCGGCWEL